MNAETFKRFRPHLIVLFLLALALLSGAQVPLRNALTDLRFHWLSRPAIGNTVFVTIDSPSIDRIGVWPWPRKLHAQLVDRLTQAGAATIAFDVDFSSPSTPADDHAFAEALKHAGGSVVLAAFQQVVRHANGTSTIHINRPLPQFADQAWIAAVNVDVERDGLVRRYGYGEHLDGKFLPSLAALLAGSYAKNTAPLQIDFGIAPNTVPRVSYVDVLRGDPATLAKLKGKNVVIGSTAVELGDRFNVPNGRVLPGAELQILAAESILQHRALHYSSALASGVGIAFIFLLMIALWDGLSAGWRTALLAALSAAIEACGFVLQARFPVILDTSLLQIVIVAYAAVVAIAEIDFRALLSRIAENRFQSIATALGDGLVCANKDGTITFWNRGAAAIFGYSSNEIVGRPLNTLFKRKGAGADGFSLLALPHNALRRPGGLLMEMDGQRKNGDAFPLEVCFSEWEGVEGVQYGAIVRDITARKREAARVLYLAEHDTLTGLVNRNKLHERLNEMLPLAQPHHSEVALLMLDLDRFKQINDTLGHGCGDQVLRGVAERLTEFVAGGGIIARLGGDEFAVVIAGENIRAEAKALSQRLCDAFGETSFSIGMRQLRVDVSIGIAVYPGDGRNVDELLGNADLALYQAKARAGGGYSVFEPALRENLEARLALEAELVRAVKNNEFELFFQPQVDLKDGRLVGAEALIRWRHPKRGLVLPDAFMPVVNASSISDEISLWAMRTACRQGRTWERQGHAVRLGINLAPSQFLADDLPDIVKAVIDETGVSAGLIELEVTESILLEDDERALAIFRRIQELGVHIAFDDFGTGYASLTYLKKFPLDRLKIDKSFVQKLLTNTDDMAIVGATISLGRLLGLSVIAEGIEDAATAALLAKEGCKEGQGYYFSQPVPASEFERRFLAAKDKTAKPERERSAA